MKHRSFFKAENKKDEHDIRPSDGKKSSDYPEVMSELYYRQLLLSNSFANWDAANAFRWIEGYANYVNVYTKLKHGSFKGSIFNPWEIVQVDFFGAFKNEMEFDHPALIYKVLDNGMLMVIPITSDKNTYREASKSKAPKDLVGLAKGNDRIGSLSKNSTLLLGQVKIISKSRIVRREFEVWDNVKKRTVKKRLKITHSATKELIKKKFALLYSGGYVDTLNKEIDTNQKQVATLTKDYEAEKKKTSQLQVENDDLKKKLAYLQEEYAKLQVKYEISQGTKETVADIEAE